MKLERKLYSKNKKDKEEKFLQRKEIKDAKKIRNCWVFSEYWDWGCRCISFINRF